MMRNLLWCFGIVASATFAADPTNSRLDPHGSPEIIFTLETMSHVKNCKICHQVKAGGRQAHILPSEQTCVLCHSKAPHSGAAEHMGRTFKEAGPGESSKIDCITCHAPHRDGLNFKMGSADFLKRTDLSIKGFYQHSSPYPLLKRTCVDCHKW
jgi:hypothetical protein